MIRPTHLLRPRQWSLRLQASVGSCVLLMLLSLAIGQLWARRAADQVHAEAGAALLQTARNMADRLSYEMAERTRDVRLLSQLDVLRGTTSPAEIRGALDRLRATLPAYAWIGVTDADGTVIAATDDVLLGQSIAARPVFLNGREGLWTGDVHEAVMLARYAPHSPGEAVKFVDVAAPIRRADGSLGGVIALHLSWQWADQLRRSVLSPRGLLATQQLSVYGPDGAVLLAPQAGMGPTLAPAQLAALQEGWADVLWSDGRLSLTAVAESRPAQQFQGFRWHVVARDQGDATAAATQQVRATALAWSIGIGLLCSLIGCWLIALLVAPVEELAHALRGSAGRPRAPGGPGTSLPRRRNDVQQIAAAVAQLQDTLKDREQAVQSLEQRALRDPLTGLWNRGFLAEMAERLADEVAQARLEVCVLCLDLDAFKPINDRHGHAAGDQVLVQVAKRLRKLAREQDFVFRLGGDEFLVLITGLPGEGSALSRTLAERIVRDMRRPMSYLTLNNLRVGCSIGAAVWPTHGPTLAEAMRHADEALYAAKHAGRGQFRQYAGVSG